MNVSEILQRWYIENHRDLPWRRSSDPYKIWISEIILQQTRVNQGITYYDKFIKNFPSIFLLADAPVDKVMKIWEGLGYYSRARNMHETAKSIVKLYNGVFPENFNELTKLKGVGDYTAAAIASIAFNKSHAVVDGNVFRVLSRYYGIDIPVNTSKGKKLFFQLATDLLDSKNPGLHNQSVMELGALICLPTNSKCTLCPISTYCIAFGNGTVNNFPQKISKSIVKDRFFYYLIIKKGTTTFIKQRNEKDIWKLLYEFPLIETSHETAIEKLFLDEKWDKFFKNETFIISKISGTTKHKLTHQTIHTRFLELKVKSDFVLPSAFEVEIDELDKYAFPRVIVKYMDQL
jgi:A/G-specific adenine glycosylase